MVLAVVDTNALCFIKYIYWQFVYFCKIHVPLCVIKILKNGKVVQTAR